MLSSFARFFEHVDIFFAEQSFGMARVVIVDQLRKPQRAGHARRAAADDDDIGWHFRMLDVRERLAEDQMVMGLMRRKMHDKWEHALQLIGKRTAGLPFLKNHRDRADHHGEAHKIVPLQRLMQIKHREDREHS